MVSRNRKRKLRRSWRPALSYLFGASTATAQAPSNPVVAVQGDGTVYTANGDAYGRVNTSTWALVGNVFGGGPTPALHESWGQVKSRYAPQGPTSPPATNR